jgi:cyclophilin family peptidyl-prolyl cis-trans isomerase
MRLAKYFIVIIIIPLILISCDNYKKVSLNDEFKNGVSIDKLVELKGHDKIVATIETSLGAIQIELFSHEAPLAVKNFVGLAVEGYYNGLIFHRVIKGFMIQTGDSLGTGEGGRSIYGKEFEDEFSPSLTFDEPGMVAMANKGPASNLSQFFITTAPAAYLNKQHTIFGKVIGGMDVVNKIGSVKINRAGLPDEKIIMQKVLVEKRVY